MSAVSAESVAALGRAPVRRGRRSPLDGLRSPTGLVGLAIVAVLGLASLVVPLLLSWGPLRQSGDALAPAWTSAHVLGTDEVGRDVLARVLAGLRLDELLVVIAVPISAALGTLLGMLSATVRWTSPLVMGVFNLVLGFPGVVMGIAVSIAIAPGRSAILVAMVLASLPGFGRTARVTTLSQLSRDYVDAAVVAGTPRGEIMLSHVLPNVLDSVIVRIAPAVGGSILLEGSLSVVGLGIQAPTASLGEMIAGGSQYLSNAPLYSLAPLAVVFVAVLALSLIGNAMNEAMLR